LFDSSDGVGVYSVLTIKLAKALFFPGLSAFSGGVPNDFLSPGKRLFGDFAPKGGLWITFHQKIPCRINLLQKCQKSWMSSVDCFGGVGL
jgi:hypothetical protein